MLVALRGGADGRLSIALGSASGSASHLGTALRWLRLFVTRCRRGDCLWRINERATLHAAVYIEETLRLFAEFVRRSGSVRRGAEGSVVSSATISD